MAKIDNLFHLLHANHGSDLHLSAGNPPLLRIYGDLARVDAPVVTTEELLAVLREMVPMERVQAFEQTGDLTSPMNSGAGALPCQLFPAEPRHFRGVPRNPAANQHG